MEKPHASKHSSREFLDWCDLGTLVISPKFQRREVWKTPARSYFIDSILKDVPIPPIFLRLGQSDDRKRVIREVIDGQQRLRAVIDYLTGRYALSKSTDKFAGKRFAELPADAQEQIKTYPFACEVFEKISDAEVLEIFARVNTFSVGLNAQELRNGRYFGRFKQSAYKLAYEHLEFWRTNRIFTENRIARMLEVELTSELMIAAIDGQQDKKTTINDFYGRFDNTFSQRTIIEDRFRTVIDTITDTTTDTLPKSEFRRAPLFYTLFCIVYHRLFGLPKITLHSPKKKRLSPDDGTHLKDAVIELSDKLVNAREEKKVPARDAAFINACLRQTDNIKPRLTRFTTLYGLAFSR